MTFTEEYIADEDRELEELANYPTAFGITFTPKVSGIAVGIGGLLASGYLLMNWVLPTYQALQQLQADKTGKEQQVQQQRGGVSPAVFQQVEAQLREKEALKKQIISLFGNAKALDTLLLDISRIFRSRNVSLVSFQPQGTSATPIADGSLGAEVNNKLKRQTFNVQLKGQYVNIHEVLQDLEQLQPLILLKNINIQAVEEGRLYRLDFKNSPVQDVNVRNAEGGRSYRVNVKTGPVRVEPVDKSKEQVTATFLLDMIVPLTPEELAKLAPPPPPEGQQGQPAK
ncbi:hypothetical protein V0288_02630 [Pannus brasiliensis CCIBt3594]|uniref:Pilus assembly protein n=1 Tax=Pannus brasiliensis CCIBt3594 TaxID=1427578 RepID=A0AAW9QFX7_9CHRO